MAPHPPSLPHICSHEFGGTIITSPPSSPYKPGDKVGVPGRGFHPCGTCQECLHDGWPDSDPAGFSVYCPSAKNHGINSDGGFREYAVVDERQVAKIPEELTPVEVAPLMCAGLTVYAALKRCALKPGQRVGIMGCGGGLGHLGLQFGTKMGYQVHGFDAADGPLALASSLETGAKIIDVRSTTAEVVKSQIGKEDEKTEKGEIGLDAVIILPESQKAFDYGMALLRNHGKCIVVSFPNAGFHVNAGDLVFRDISVVGSLIGSNRVLKEMLEFCAKEGVRAITRKFPLSRLNELVGEYDKGAGGKLVVDMSMEE
jgi:D-arabinose 1-dehydrogenase-like Zn-dependent alcohol dehydrogenase